MTENQFLASDPDCSVWVSASAGTGKTKVLTDRVLRLLLAGTPPSRILCITYTKAAAAEMQNRIHKELSRWVSLPPEKLTLSLLGLTGTVPKQKTLQLATTLFAKVVDDGEGVRIHTIHAFCQSLLQRFPLEAATPPHFTVIDDRTAAELVQEAKLRLFAEKIEEDKTLAEAIHALSGELSETGFTGLVMEIIQNRRNIMKLFSRPNGIERIIENMWQQLGVSRNSREEEIFQRHFTYSADEEALLTQAASLLMQGNETEQELGRKIEKWLLQKNERYSFVTEYLFAFLTQKGEPRKTLCHKDFKTKYPHIEETLRHEQQRVAAYNEICKARSTAITTTHIIIVAEALLAIYEHLKRTRSFLDYDDLILHTHALLQRQGMAPWVLYKLDGGLDHILVDEAQDTSAMQWDIMQTLIGEFFAGESSRTLKRTLFVVGDEKQSIFSFQGAEPKEFLRMRQLFAGRIKGAGQELRPISLGVSFRSTEPVLQAVDAVFSTAEMKASLGFAEMEILHEARRTGHAGRVELWPVIKPLQEKEEKTPWRIPNAYAPASKPAYILANKIADVISGWLREGKLLQPKGRPITPGDVLVLVQKRNFFVPYLIKALKQRNVAVAGVDRMQLMENIAVMDLVALGRFLLLPEDDLSLAAILKSPLIGLTEEDLFTLAYGRGKASLWQRLKESAFEQAHEYLAALLGRTDYVPVYELYAHVLEGLGGRRKFIARLGEECNDPIDEFLNYALDYERTHASALEGFLHWLTISESEVKRDMEQGRDEVRIMTVHGAKGLQAPIVFLPDTVSLPISKERLLWQEDEEVFFWSGRLEDAPELCQRLRESRREETEQEYRRLLYVAMTRAEDELYICGWSNKEKIGDHSWYSMIRNNFAPIAQETNIPLLADTGKSLVLFSEQLQKADLPVVNKLPASSHPLPKYLLQPPAAEPALPRPLTPAHSTEASAIASPVTENAGFNRGTIVHRLLQYLPELPDGMRESRGLLYVQRQAPHINENEAKEMLREVLALMANKEFAPLFGPGSIAEAPISGIIEINDALRAVSGQVDRLLVTPEAVWIIDYKTHRNPPASIEEAPAQYIFQMRAYYEVLRRIYPDRPVHCALLWTIGPYLMPLQDFSHREPLDYMPA